ncbi:MAG: hypothetical protein AB7F51_10920, partial [Pseudorhodoplanes sp.]
KPASGGQRLSQNSASLARRNDARNRPDARTALEKPFPSDACGRFSVISEGGACASILKPNTLCKFHAPDLTET